MTRPNKSGSKSNRTVQNVRMVDPYSGTEGARVDRQIQHLVASESQIQSLCTESFSIDSSSTVQIRSIYGWQQIRNFDEFVSLAAQYNTYRIKSIRFDVYDINPGNTATGFFSTFHDAYNSGSIPVFSLENVVDGPDSQLVPPGIGKISLTWTAHNTNERGFYDATPDLDALSPDYGGLRLVVPQAATSAAKFRVVIKAVVDFRGRR